MDLDFRGLMVIGRAEWRKLHLNPGFILRPALWFTPNTLPVVGIDAVVAQDILFALRAVDHQGRGVADDWLRALQCAQLAHDRLLRDLHDVDRNLTFWQRQVSAGGVWSHGAFMLLSRGPMSFAEDVGGAARTGLQVATRGLAPLLALIKSSEQQQQGQQQQGRREQGREERPLAALGGPNSGPPSTSSPSLPWGTSHSSATATDMMQQRVLLLRGLRQRLAQALAELAHAAGGLRVGDLLAAVEPGGLLPSTAAPSAAAGAGGELASPPVGFAAAAAAVAEGRLPSSSSSGAAKQHRERESGAVQAVEDAVRTAVHGMRAALEGLMSYAGAGTDAAAPRDPHKQKQQPASKTTERPLSLELRDLLDLLRLQQPAGQAFGALVPEPQAAAASPPQQQQSGQGAAAAAAAAGAPEASGATAGDGGSGGGPMGLHLTSGGCSAAAALGAARRAAALAGPLVPLPATARMPSRFQRHWLRYCAIGGLVLYGGAYLVRHSRLAGSDDLDRWMVTAVSAVRSALRTHVAEPLAAVRDELFRTFRDRPAIVSAADFSLSRESLLRMLEAFAEDRTRKEAAGSGTTRGSSSGAAATASTAGANSGSSSGSSGMGEGAAVAPSAGGSGGGSGAGEDAALAAGMDVLMRSYEVELRKPLRNLLLGDLARALLIQIQHVKVDGEAAMLRLDQILRANELSISLLAALPALAISMGVAAGAARLLIPRAPDPKRAAVPSRLAMAHLEVALTQLAAAEERQQQQQEEERRRKQQQQQQQQQQEAQEASADAGGAAAATASAASAAVEELRGLVEYRLYMVYSEVTALYATADRTSRFSEWRQLYDDLLRLAAPAAPRERLTTHQRMMRTYTVFQR
ncbi:hypothetical protein PLESTB_001566900 [Pleodorina starrii]|uniref:Uncharacterized protein n=1 Tax=Pleodorina starrii TaxID=330485 RepID=A0A9W6BWW1_9CHLO|nr:hypothetical protein PLESTB_001566900 [Pleodorina starrii]GLC72733.1 hypothetical protein PLESTF_001287300 [Pleodorina starrii]